MLLLKVRLTEKTRGAWTTELTSRVGLRLTVVKDEDKASDREVKLAIPVQDEENHAVVKQEDFKQEDFK